MESINKQKGTRWIILTIVVLIIAIVITVFVVHPYDSLNMLVNYSVELLITIFVIFICKEHIHIEQMKRKLLISTVDEMIGKFDNPNLYTITNNTDIECVLAVTKELADTCQIMIDNTNKRDIITALQEVKKQIYYYHIFITNHKTDVSYLKKSKSDLRYIVDQIRNKLQTTKYMIYK